MIEEKATGFKKAVTIFIDILGSQYRKDFSEWHKIMNIFANTIYLEKELDDSHPHTIYKREIHIFSDCAYIIYDYKPDISDSRKNVNALLCIACYNTEKVLFEFLRSGFVARGAITYGDIYYDNDKNVWFGPAMNRAFMLESKIARYPRVIIDPDFAPGLVEYNDLTYRKYELQNFWNGDIIKRDADGYFYLHYLNGYEMGFYNLSDPNFEEKTIQLCKDEIEKPRENEKIKESIREKYSWLQKYVQHSSPKAPY